MKKSDKKADSLVTQTKSQPAEIKIHKDFSDFGRITSENLNEYFDVDLMAAAERKY